jgi:hypothetical protein
MYVELDFARLTMKKATFGNVTNVSIFIASEMGLFF